MRLGRGGRGLPSFLGAQFVGEMFWLPFSDLTCINKQHVFFLQPFAPRLWIALMTIYFSVTCTFALFTVIAAHSGTYSSTPSYSSLRLFSPFFLKIHSSTFPLALISKKAQLAWVSSPAGGKNQYPFCFLPASLSQSLHSDHLTCFLSRCLPLNNSRFVFFDFVLHGLELSHPPISSFTSILLNPG